MEPADKSPNIKYASRAINRPPTMAAIPSPTWKVISSQADVAMRDLLVAAETANANHNVCERLMKERKKI